MSRLTSDHIITRSAAGGPRDGLRLYGELIREIDERLDALSMTMRKPENRLPFIVAEHAAFQLRMLCETLAIALVVSHEILHERLAPAKLRDEYHAVNIIRGLKRADPRFFPLAVEADQKAISLALLTNTHPPISIERRTPQPLDPSKIERLYEWTGDSLHRGHLKRAKANQRLVVGEKFFTDWIKDFREHLSVHVIRSVERGIAHIVFLHVEGASQARLVTIKGPIENDFD